ncbi:hypothetical protein EYD10_03800 [Varanus komodoensis]|nr:hypothetical protein EYD10_03800 [Varanus komodoensis]
MVPQHYLLESTVEIGAEPLQSSASNPQSRKSIQKDTMVDGIESRREVQKNQQGCTPPVLLPAQVVVQGDQGRFSTVPGSEAGLKRIQIISFLQECLELSRHHSLQHLAQKRDCQKDPQLVDKIMKDLDSNKDNEVDFNEFVVLVAALTVACNDFFEEQMRKKGE